MVSLVAFLATFAAAPVWSDWTRQVRPDALFGPFDAAGSLAGLRAAFLHAVLLGSLVWWLLGGSTRESTSWLAPTLLLLTAADIGMSNGWMILTAPQSDWTEASIVAARIADDESRDGWRPAGSRVPRLAAELASRHLVAPFVGRAPSRRLSLGSADAVSEVPLGKRLGDGRGLRQFGLVRLPGGLGGGTPLRMAASRRRRRTGSGSPPRAGRPIPDLPRRTSSIPRPRRLPLGPSRPVRARTSRCGEIRKPSREPGSYTRS